MDRLQQLSSITAVYFSLFLRVPLPLLIQLLEGGGGGGREFGRIR